MGCWVGCWWDIGAQGIEVSSNYLFSIPLSFLFLFPYFLSNTFYSFFSLYICICLLVSVLLSSRLLLLVSFLWSFFIFAFSSSYYFFVSVSLFICFQFLYLGPNYFSYFFFVLLQFFILKYANLFWPYFILSYLFRLSSRIFSSLFNFIAFSPCPS
jgi:hypothetical protein